MAKSRKQTIMENTLSMDDIMKEFKTYETGAEKAKFLREMDQLNLPYDVKWENLAQCWEGTKSWPVFSSSEKQKDENILSDGGTEEVTTMDDKPLTHEELEALI